MLSPVQTSLQNCCNRRLTVVLLLRCKKLEIFPICCRPTVLCRSRLWLAWTSLWTWSLTKCCTYFLLRKGFTLEDRCSFSFFKKKSKSFKCSAAHRTRKSFLIFLHLNIFATKAERDFVQSCEAIETGESNPTYIKQW